MPHVKPLKPEDLYIPCDPAQFSFTTTAELGEMDGIIGQARAVAAIRFGMGMAHEGFNLYVLGANGTGKYTAVNQFLAHKASQEPAPNDWCYVHNFAQPHQPQGLQLPTGQATHFREEMKQLVTGLFTVIPTAFSSQEYQSQRKKVEAEVREEQKKAVEDLRAEALQRNIALIQTPAGFAFAPLHKGEVVSPDEFLKMPAEKQQAIEQEVTALQESLQKVMQQIPQWQRDIQKKIKELNEEVVTFAVAPLFAEIEQNYAAQTAVCGYLTAVQQDVVNNVDSAAHAGLIIIGSHPDNLSRTALALLIEQTHVPVLIVR